MAPGTPSPPPRSRAAAPTAPRSRSPAPTGSSSAATPARRSSSAESAFVDADDGVRDADGLLPALALEGELHDHLGAARDFLELRQLGAHADLAVDGHGGREADLVEAVVHREGEP